MNTHHAYLKLLSEVSIETVENTVATLGISEVSFLSSDSFGVNEVKDLTEKAYMMPVSADRQLIVVLAKFITEEAQQALLKILEEPPKTTTFLFAVPHSLYLLPTLLSRFHKLDTDSLNSDGQTLKLFLELSKGDRFVEIAKRVEDKDIIWIAGIKSSLLFLLSSQSKIVNKEDKSHLYWVASHLQTRGASNKQLLEELALSLA